MNFTEVEKALMPVISPMLLTIWSGTILPAVQAALKSGSPEIQIVETAIAEMLDSVVKAELAKLA